MSRLDRNMAAPGAGLDQVVADLVHLPVGEVDPHRLLRGAWSQRQAGNVAGHTLTARDVLPERGAVLREAVLDGSRADEDPLARRLDVEDVFRREAAPGELALDPNHLLRV